LIFVGVQVFFVGCSSQDWLVAFFFSVIIRTDLMSYCSVIFSSPASRKRRAGMSGEIVFLYNFSILSVQKLIKEQVL
jgi:hypothetical protein